MVNDAFVRSVLFGLDTVWFFPGADQRGLGWKGVFETNIWWTSEVVAPVQKQNRKALSYKVFAETSLTDMYWSDPLPFDWQINGIYILTV